MRFRVDKQIGSYPMITGGVKKEMATATKILSRIKGDDVKAQGITELTILSVAEQNKFGKLQCRVVANDKAKTQADWQLNAQSNNALIDQFGTETAAWVGKKIPVLTKDYESGVGINVDVSKLGEILQ